MKLKIFFIIFLNLNLKICLCQSPDILLLGNITSSMGYKNVVVDKSNFIIKNSDPKDLWFLLEI